MKTYCLIKTSSNETMKIGVQEIANHRAECIANYFGGSAERAMVEDTIHTFADVTEIENWVLDEMNFDFEVSEVVGYV